MITANFTFDVDIMQKIRSVKTKGRNRGIRIAMNKSAAPVKAAVIDSAPVGTGALKQSIRIKIKSYRRGDVWVAVIGPSRSYKRKRKGKEIRPARYAHIVELKQKKFLAPAFSRSFRTYYAELARNLEDQFEQYFAT